MNEDKVWRGARGCWQGVGGWREEMMVEFWGGGAGGGQQRPTASCPASPKTQRRQEKRGGEETVPCPEVTNRLQLVLFF